MDFLRDDIGKLYKKYLSASLFSAIILSVYSFVDTIAVGQSEGEAGAASMAVMAPLFGILVFVSLLIGVGGSVLLGNARGQGKNDRADLYFTSSVILMCIVGGVTWAVFILFGRELLGFFGADSTLIPKTMEYAQWIMWFCPVFITPIFLSSFVRNDGNPGLAMRSVLIGGCVNMFLDWLLVFPLGMNMTGAALATLVGTFVQLAILLSHFFSKKNSLRLVRPRHIGRAFRTIFSIGFGAGIIELGTVVIAVIINNQIDRFGSNTELAVYGVVATMAALFQALFSGIGQAVQPLVSANHGAGNHLRNREFWNMALRTVIVTGIIFTAIGELFPSQTVALFVNATPEILAAAPGILRIYFTLFVPLGLSILAIYYMQSTLHGRFSLFTAALRGIILSGILLFALPELLGITGIWLALPISETAVAVIAVIFTAKSIRKECRAV